MPKSGTRLDLSALSRWVEGAADVPVEAWADAVHDAILRSMQEKSSRIPIDSGALRRSLLNRRDRAHHYVAHPDGSIEYGSTLGQAFYQRHRIPAPNTRAVATAYADAITDYLNTLPTE